MDKKRWGVAKRDIGKGGEGGMGRWDL